VNVAARLKGLVEGGEICISQGGHDHLCHRGGMILEDLGKQTDQERRAPIPIIILLL
jgi:hypothetical protein